MLGETFKEEFLVDLVCYLYDREKISFAKAKSLADLDHISFQKELSKRNIFIKYELDDLEEDFQTIEKLPS